MLTGTALAAVVGSPVAHSLSPAMHNAAYHELGLTHWRYGRRELSVAEFPAFLAGRDDRWRGLSLTMPLKEMVFAAEIGGQIELSTLAYATGSANTLVRRAAGRWIGDNTDVHGVVEALSVAVPAGEAGEALVLGSGATARSVLAAVRRMGVRVVELAVRDSARPPTVTLAAALGLTLGVSPLSEAAARVLAAPLVVSTLPPAGAAPVAAAVAELAARTAAPPLDPGRSPRVLLDVVYAGWPTPLARAYAATGGQVVSGFEMLLHQGGEQVRLMTGLRPPLEVMRAAGLRAMKDD